MILVLAALAALPSAVALEQVEVGVPDAHVHADGTSAEVPEAGTPVGVGGTVQVNAVDVSVSETECAVSTKTDVKDHGADRASCTPGEVRTSAESPSGLVEADIDLVLPAAAPVQGPAEPQGVGTAAQLVDALPARETVLLAAAAASASMLGLYAVWRVLKWTGLAAVLPLYSHITDDEILDDANRAGIYRLIQTEPGISTKDVADRLDLAWGTVTHHLGKLEKRRFVVSKKYGKYRRYFANGAGGVQEKDALAVLRLDRTGDVAQLIRTQPGLTQKAVSQLLGVSSSTILWHVKRLEEVQLVRKVREGKLVRYYPGEGAGVTLIPAAPAVPTTAA